MNPPFTRATGRGERFGEARGLFGFIVDESIRKQFLEAYERVREDVRGSLRAIAQSASSMLPEPLRQIVQGLMPETKQYLSIGQAGEGLLFLYLAYRYVKNGVVVESTLYHYETNNVDEAYYLVAILNSSVLDELIKPMQSKGEFGERDIHKKPLEFPIPRYDPNNDVHRCLSELGRKASEIAVSYMNPDYTPKSLKELEANEFKDLPAKPGVYIVFWFRGGRPAPIPRILGVDERGILYIGSAGKSKTKGRAKSVSRVKGLRDRIRELWISIKMAYGLKERKRYPHTFGPSLVYTGLCKVINAEDLWIYYKVFDECEAEY